MLTADQRHRCALAANALRPSWSVAQLDAVLADPRVDRYDGPTVARALCWIAVDGKIRQPTALFVAGTWWDFAGITKAEQNAPHYRRAHPHDCHECGLPENAHPTSICPEGYTRPAIAPRPKENA